LAREEGVSIVARDNYARFGKNQWNRAGRGQLGSTTMSSQDLPSHGGVDIQLIEILLYPSSLSCLCNQPRCIVC
jgi:hypothetical protein